MHGVPILMYHRLFEDPAELAGWPKGMTRHWVAAQDFERQMCALVEHGYRAVPLSALLGGAPAAGTARPIVITFDDGWASDHRYARPILERLGWASEHFATVDWIGTDHFVAWAQLDEIARSGAAVQSHSMTHRDLDRLAAPAVRDELERSKATLEQRLGRAVAFLALPGGTGAGREVRAIAHAAGYRGICTSRIGLNAAGADTFAWRRIPLTRHTPLASLLKWVDGTELERLALTQETLRLTRALVPRPLYASLRELVLR